jgi:hypothetical protein
MIFKTNILTTYSWSWSEGRSGSRIWNQVGDRTGVTRIWRWSRGKILSFSLNNSWSRNIIWSWNWSIICNQSWSRDI